MAIEEISLGEYIRRRRRAIGLSLSDLADKTGVAYTHLSRIEADSTTPGVETVSKICPVIDGDLKAMLEMADCLPRLILDRIESRQAREGPVLNRAFPEKNTPAEDLHRRLTDVIANARLGNKEESEVMATITNLLALSKTKRDAVASIIEMLYAEGHESST